MFTNVSALLSNATETPPPVLDDVPDKTSGSSALKASSDVRVTMGEVKHWIDVNVFEMTLQAVLQIDTTDPIPVPLTFRVPNPEPVIVTTLPPPNERRSLVTFVTDIVAMKDLVLVANPNPLRVRKIGWIPAETRPTIQLN